jgi:hypothetical protein
MEKLNLNFSGGDNVIKSICWILSVLSWLLFIITGWISLRWLDYFPYNIVWTIRRYEFVEPNDLNFKGLGAGYYPIQMQSAMLYIVFIVTMIIALAGFILYMVKSTCKKDNAVFDGMMGQWARFHFCPLLCVSALFIIGENVDNPVPKNNTHHEKDMYISSTIFTIIGLLSLIFIYIMTDLNTDWYVVLTLKKGTYSCLIVLLWYNFCYLIYWLRYLDFVESPWNKKPSMKNWKNGCGISFSIIFGLGSLIFSFFFKDLVAAGMNALIYIGLTAYYFQLDKESRKTKELNKNGDGAVDIIMMVFSVVLIAFLIIKNKEDCLKS